MSWFEPNAQSILAVREVWEQFASWSEPNAQSIRVVHKGWPGDSLRVGLSQMSKVF